MQAGKAGGLAHAEVVAHEDHEPGIARPLVREPAEEGVDHGLEHAAGGCAGDHLRTVDGIAGRRAQAPELGQKILVAGLGAGG